MSIEITEKLVTDIAHLSRLSLSTEEKAEMHGHFAKILNFVESLDTLDIDSIDPSVFPLETVNVMRPDESRPSIGAEKALMNAPSQRDGFFLVPRIIQLSH